MYGFLKKLYILVNKVKDTLDLLKTKECVYEKDNAIWLKTTWLVMTKIEFL